MSLQDLQTNNDKNIGPLNNLAQESLDLNSNRSLFNFKRNHRNLARVQGANQATVRNLSQMLLALQSQNEELNRRLMETEGSWKNSEELMKMQE